jgi:glutathione S-transferase
MAEIIACDIHPVNNLRILRALTGLGVDEPAATPGSALDHRRLHRPWSRWSPSTAGLRLRRRAGLADCCLVPQVYNAERFKTDLTPFPAIRAVARGAPNTRPSPPPIPTFSRTRHPCLKT